MSALRGNLHALEDAFGRANLLAICCTTRRASDAKFQERFAKFARHLNRGGLVWAAKIERHAHGAQHCHMVCGKRGLNFDGEAALVRKAAKAAGFGRCRVEAVADGGFDALALYMAKTSGLGRRAVRCSKSFSAVSKYSGNVMFLTTQTANWRHGCAMLAATIGAGDLDALSARLGRNWAYCWRATVGVLGHYWQALRASPSQWQDRLAFLRSQTQGLPLAKRKVRARQLAEKLETALSRGEVLPLPKEAA